MTFGEKLSRLRRERQYTQEQLAQLLSVSRQSVSRWESDVAFPEMDKLIRLSTLFAVSLDDLLKDGAQASIASSPIDGRYGGFVGAWCDIALKGWDSGYTQAGLIGEDADYLAFYQTNKRRQLKYGIVRKCYIDTVTKLAPKRQNVLPVLPKMEQLPMDLFAPLMGKICDVQLHSSDLVAFILDDDGQQRALVREISDDRLCIEDDAGVVLIDKTAIAGIVES